MPRYVGICIHHSAVIRSSNSTTRLPLSRIASTWRREIGRRHHSSSMRQVSPMDSIRFPFPVFGFTNAGTPRSSSSTSTRCGTFSARSLSGLFRIPHSALGFIVDQRVAAFGDARPWLDGDDVVQHRALKPELDLLDGGAERAAPAGPGGGARVAREELQLGRPRREPGELDGEPLHGPDGGRLLEAGLERRSDAVPVRRRVLERRLGEPRRAVLELGARTYHLYPPAGAAREPVRRVAKPLLRMRTACQTCT